MKLKLTLTSRLDFRLSGCQLGLLVLGLSQGGLFALLLFILAKLALFDLLLESLETCLGRLSLLGKIILFLLDCLPVK